MSAIKLLFFQSLISFFSRILIMPSIFILFVGVFIFPFDSIGQGNLLVTPRRVVFDGSSRSVDLNLANIGQDTATYAISMVQIRMKEDGGFETITEPDEGQEFANKNIRYFPRTVVLPPDEAQVVKVQLLRANKLEPGEYRSHFYFRSIPKIVALGEEETEIDTTGISVRLTPVFGITIPAIIRIGESNTKITITDVALNKDEDVPKISLRFNRTGNFSVYGDLTVDHISPDGNRTNVGMANGIAVYTPNLARNFQFGLSKAEGVDLSSGKLILQYSAPNDVKPERYAEAELELR
ncbi:MAG: molecular chaperone [Bacteroidota bacterium]|nr:molecular chaperone [Bacteroidota bacterium]